MSGFQPTQRAIVEAECAEVSRTAAHRRGRQLVRLGFITEAAIRDIMARTVGQESIDLAQVVAYPEALKLVPQDFARRHRLLPIAYNADGSSSVTDARGTGHGSASRSGWHSSRA